MSTRRSARFLLGAVGVATGAFLVLVGIAVFLLWQNEDMLTQETYDQSGIAAIQLRVHYETVMGALARARIDDRAEVAKDVAVQFDIFYERMKALPSRPSYEVLLDKELLGLQKSLLAALTAELPAIDAVARGDRAALAGMYERLLPLNKDVVRLAHRPVQIASELRTDARAKLSQVASWLTFVIVAFALSGGAFVVVIWRQMRSAITRQQQIEKSKDDLQAAKKQLEVVAYIDSLTGLPNRTQCQRDLSARFEQGAISRPFAFIQIDLDNFKRVNDTLGHAAGDELLHVLGLRLLSFASEWPGFQVYRWGGDEFVALLDIDEGTSVDAICEDLTVLISQPVDYANATLRPTISVGIARYPEDTSDAEALVIFADLALYKAKELGRDRYQFFTTEMKRRIDAESRLEEELRAAIAENQFELYFQPQINTRDESIAGFEALLRWNHPERGILAPGAFLGVAENSGLAPAIGRRVFDMAMRATRRWVDDGLRFGRLAVNLSPQHLSNGALLRDFCSAMAAHGVAPNLLAVELLESFLLDDRQSNIQETLNALRDSGVSVELDDFGTGYASLAHLSTMPITGIKVDRSFICGINDDPKRMNIVSSLISMSKLMGLRVVCEGVETADHVAAIKQVADCTVQGYYIARPMPFAAATAWIREGRNIGLLTRHGAALTRSA